MGKGSSGEDLFLFALGGLIGAAMAQPKEAEKTSLHILRITKKNSIIIFRLKIIFMNS
ncbi:hypothetical protein LEP1GSC151_0590 [Leptospira interrogans serovar Grippotyphosa str. LT2186]|uniref:Uncharacterized protein n=1 Tax=Leptospira interrogans serovar Grippotyphosa str. LT2186 TaxID=1001599 RepID=M3I265_LEPIR|nr:MULTISPECIES: hypothetical protein [Leptospira]EMG10007.1 hypothetical protein LEP1GSC151_0590 [Leptospira interrogans serovar Grippotyphosa str. LT2186]EKO88295.1 hypothetical protein LEP1GSC009_1650 [Leptospira interrogans serovar Grippotyphosa str. Andaman]EKP87352.1 hypothetical protein LEP1GSC020_3831 [Leptospira interrogans serovar Grippotyphosa str. 2006006986]EKR46646.1 hypothetical protein LEP1GSC097_2814 [Leptospira interrogans serovar Grippotyphosa str. UI 08368]EMN66130.1 hypoth